nr:uncharacterized protein LOC111413645 [Onthophagus taurus]
MFKVSLKHLNIFFVLFISLFLTTEAIRCFQCSSDNDGKNQDNCGAYRKFDKREHIAIECTSDESHMPGSFCLKSTRQSPKGFIWDGRWRQVIRQCASVAETGITGVCNWGVYPNGVFWQECYCSSDECNSTTTLKLSFGLGFIVLLNIYYFY